MPAIPQLARIEAYFSDEALLALEFFLNGALRCHVESGYSPFTHVAGDKEAGRRMALSAEQLHAAMERAMTERQLTPLPRPNAAAVPATPGVPFAPQWEAIEWIGVDLAMPDSDTMVMVSTAHPDEEPVALGWYDDETGFWHESSAVVLTSVTHWAAVPFGMRGC
ncbi:DUF551 domain-containing protein [Pigmentiphaga sp. CHJ604]|uniref:DUF551 domain-containing protein n=1 Tax=Pigmentiphaga sp. CHJ604 TaxID=3081984 RepID=UPI0030CB4DBD